MSFAWIFQIVFSLLLLPVNICCVFWLVQEALKLCGMTTREFLDRTSDVSFPSRSSSDHLRRKHNSERMRRRQRFMVRFFREHSSDPEKSIRLLWTFGFCTLPGLAALLLARYAALHPDRLTSVFVGNVLLAALNFGLYYIGRVYRNTHRLDEKTEELLAAKRQKEKRKPNRKNVIVYTLVGAFFFLVLLGFHLGMARVATPAARSVDHTEVNSVLTERGFETADIPTTFWEYDENKLMYVCAGVKGKTKFEFYEYMDGETTDLVFNSISYQVAPELEPRERDSHITELPAGNRVFTVRIDGISHLVMYQNNTVVYAYSSGSMEEVQGILTELGYLEEKPSP